MLFNSLSFAIFLPIVFLLYWIMPHKYRWMLLLVASYYFYMSWDVNYIILILFTTTISFVAGLLIEKQQNMLLRKIILITTGGLCLGVLFFFKYFNFVAESVSDLLGTCAINIHPVTLDLLLPVGISFYTFQTLSYVIDVYGGGNCKAEHNFGVYAAYVSFFPQLVAGPIERSENLIPQIKEKKIFDYAKATYGLRLMAWGFFKKMAIADAVAVYVDRAYGNLKTCTGFDLFIAVFFFSIQIYCDFSGYSDIAIGCAKLMGIDLMINFRSPYFSDSIKEFWKRWHISLSTWFRDYLYIPLGGNRCSKTRNKINLMITFLLSGLWHGADWTFILWGGIHGGAQVIENSILRKRANKIPSYMKRVLIFIFCSFAWVFFRAENIREAIFIIIRLLSFLSIPDSFIHSNIGMSATLLFRLLVSIFLLAVYDFISMKIDVIDWVSSRNVVVRWCVYFALVFYTVCNMPLEKSAFIYFQF